MESLYYPVARTDRCVIKTKITDQELVDLYKQGISQKEIAAKFGCAQCTVSSRLIKMGIKTKQKVDKDDVESLHNQGYTDKEIALVLGCTRSNITICLNNLGHSGRRSQKKPAELRSRISEKLIGRFVGKNNPNYKGYSDEKTIARGIFKTFSKRLMRERNYVCQCCGRRGGNLEVHHIKPFSLIMKEFLSTSYDGNIDTIYNQLMNYNDFVDENNMAVLCHACHFKVHYTDNHELSPFRWESATTIESKP